MIVFYKNKLIKLDEYGFLDTSVLLESVKKDKIKTFQSIPLNREEVGEYLKSNTIQLTSETKKLFVNQFLECDYLRADIDPYDEKIVEDPNRGHWDLWTEEPKSNSIKITVNSPFVGRNPISDIKEDGIIGIDFLSVFLKIGYLSGKTHIHYHCQRINCRIGCRIEHVHLVTITQSQSQTVHTTVKSL